MRKKILILILVLLLIIGLAVYYWIAIKPAEKETLQEQEQEQEDRSAIFSVSGSGNSPVFSKELVIDPFYKVKSGEKQTFSIWAKDKDGIKKVSFTTLTDAGKETAEMELVEGDEKEGKWSGSWVVQNISSRPSYQTEFVAENINSETTKLTISWETE